MEDRIKKEKRPNKKRSEDRYAKVDKAIAGIAHGTSEVDAKRKRHELETLVVPTLDANTREKYENHLKEHGLEEGDVQNYHGNKDEDYVKGLDEHKQRAMQRRQNGKHLKTERHQAKRTEAAINAAMASTILETTQGGALLEPEHEGERTDELTQHELKSKYLDMNTARHIYDLDLTEPYGPYGMEYDHSGRHAILYGKVGGHVAMMDAHLQSLECEMFLNEAVHSATTLHNHKLFALAQAKHVYIYDNKGSEIHHCHNLRDPLALTYLPHHWLMVAASRHGNLFYQDTSTGETVAQLKTAMGPIHTIRRNPQTAVVHCAHGRGAVTLWTPVSNEYLIKMQCHRGPILDIAIDQTGTYMVTSGADKLVKVWDLRVYKCLSQLRTYNNLAATTVDISQRNGIVAMGHGSIATFWNGLKEHSQPYMKHRLMNGRQIETLRFRPFEDVCGIGHSRGIASIVIPGSGEPNLDSFDLHNPFADNKQMREMEVRSLLDKLSPNTIALEGSGMIGRVLRPHEKQMQVMEEDLTKAKTNFATKNKARGRNKLSNQLAQKHQNVIDATIAKVRQQAEREELDHAAKLEQEQKEAKKQRAPAALRRFY